MIVKTLAEEIYKLAQAAETLGVRRRRLAKAIKAGAEEARLTHAALAEKTAVSESYLSELLSGRRWGPAGDKKLKAIAEFLIQRIREGRKTGGTR